MKSSIMGIESNDLLISWELAIPNYVITTAIKASVDICGHVISGNGERDGNGIYWTVTEKDGKGASFFIDYEGTFML